MTAWRDKARLEISSIKPTWAERFGWAPLLREKECAVDLYVRLCRHAASEGPARAYVLRLRYESDYETAGRGEAFVNPEKWEEEGPQYWPVGVRGFNPSRTPPAICLEGTRGFHSDLHRERDGRRANLNRLLLELQRCIDE